MVAVWSHRATGLPEWGGGGLVRSGRRWSQWELRWPETLFGEAQRGVDGVDGLVGDMAQQMAVDLGGGRQGGVAHRLGRHRQRHLRGQHGGRGEVAQVVHPDARQVGLVGERVQVPQDVLGPQRLPAAPGEGEVLLLVGGAGGDPLEALPLGLAAQRGHRAAGQPDPGVAAAGLGGGEHRRGVVDVGQRPADEQQAGVEVDVGPVQRECFALAQAGADDEFEQLGEWVGDGCAVLQEGHGLDG